MREVQTWISMAKNAPQFKKPQGFGEFPEHLCPELHGDSNRIQEEYVYKTSVRLPRDKNAANLIESLWEGGMEASFDFLGDGKKTHRARVIAYTEHDDIEFGDDCVFEIYLELNEDMIPPPEDPVYY